MMVMRASILKTYISLYLIVFNHIIQIFDDIYIILVQSLFFLCFFMFSKHSEPFLWPVSTVPRPMELNMCLSECRNPAGGWLSPWFFHGFFPPKSKKNLWENHGKMGVPWFFSWFFLSNRDPTIQIYVVFFTWCFFCVSQESRYRHPNWRRYFDSIMGWFQAIFIFDPRYISVSETAEQVGVQRLPVSFMWTYIYM